MYRVLRANLSNGTFWTLSDAGRCRSAPRNLNKCQRDIQIPEIFTQHVYPPLPPGPTSAGPVHRFASGSESRPPWQATVGSISTAHDCTAWLFTPIQGSSLEGVPSAPRRKDVTATNILVYVSSLDRCESCCRPVRRQFVKRLLTLFAREVRALVAPSVFASDP
ncbi:hypothetical protein FKP32DRAFT_1290375 [Trametes sanguinea]|nr:hypothetical protein FKP32DRAFT_1290375 [Trametes sanguinea]